VSQKKSQTFFETQCIHQLTITNISKPQMETSSHKMKGCFQYLTEILTNGIHSLTDVLTALH